MRALKEDDLKKHPSDVVDMIAARLKIMSIDNLCDIAKPIAESLIYQEVVTIEGLILRPTFTENEMPYANWLESRGVSFNGLKPSDIEGELFMYRTPGSETWRYIDEDEYVAYTGKPTENFQAENN